jgi:hypothetical protein
LGALRISRASQESVWNALGYANTAAVPQRVIVNAPP